MEALAQERGHFLRKLLCNLAKQLPELLVHHDHPECRQEFLPDAVSVQKNWIAGWQPVRACCTSTQELRWSEPNTEAHQQEIAAYRVLRQLYRPKGHSVTKISGSFGCNNGWTERAFVEWEVAEIVTSLALCRSVSLPELVSP